MATVLRTDTTGEEWHTPEKQLFVAWELFGTIELDVASSEEANSFVKASRYYDRNQDGLSQIWVARSVWLNPPMGRARDGGSKITPWVDKFICEYTSGNMKEGLMLVNAATDAKWCQRLAKVFPVCLLDHRLSFRKKGSTNVAPISSLLVYAGSRIAEFVDVCDPALGPVLMRIQKR